MLDRTLPL